MNNLIFTAEDAYNKFLIDIRRWYTGQVDTDLFCWIWNDSALECIKSKLPLIEFTQKRIDDVECLRVVTDGSPIGFPLIPSDSANTFPIPVRYSAYKADGLMYVKIGNDEYPLYLHGLLASFKDPVTDEIIPANILRSDQKAVSLTDPYRKPKKSRVLYEHINGHIRMLGTSSSLMRLEYYRYPKLLKYDDTDTKNNIDPEFNPSMNQEITGIAVRTFLENRQNPRYKSQLQEMAIRGQHN